MGRTCALVLILLVFGCTESYKEKLPEEDLTSYVDPMIGTGGHGHTFPGATLPHGMVQLSPSNDFKNWDWCSGYHYSDSIIKGFAHNHISGPGLAALGDILLMPTSIFSTNPGTETNPDSGYRSRFSHDTEMTSPGYYKVHLDDENIVVELTTTNRVGFHRYTFETAGEKHVIIDPTHNIAEHAYETSIEILNDNQIRGYKKSEGAAGDRMVFFLASFSKPFLKGGITYDDEPVEQNVLISKSARGYASFEVLENESIEVQVALSYVSYEGAFKNWQEEAEGKAFDDIWLASKNIWNSTLNKLIVGEEDLSKKRTFYTALYHTMISPNLISDVDGKYYVEGKVRQSAKQQYSNFSTWDTHRALHPLLTILSEEKTGKIISSMVSRHAEEGLILPGWEALGYDNVCMIGYNMTSPIADAVLKDIPGIDHEEAFAALKAAAMDRTKNSPNYDVNGMDGYLKYGYVNAEVGSSVSKTTEQNYYDWAIARVAEKLDKTEEARYFYERSKGWRNLLDTASNYLLPKSATGKSISMDTLRWDGLKSNYVSGNIWAYSAYTPHDMQAAIQLRGGRDGYLDWLNWQFENDTPIEGEQHVDISGFIGKYGHGDEPGHEMPYLFAVAGQPWKTQEYVNKIITEMYIDRPDGLINNEDLGQMSAWYVFSALGFYPLAPGDLVYQLGAPQFTSVNINLESGKTFKILGTNRSDQNIYVQEVLLNGAVYDKTYISHENIMNGGELEFIMGSTPNMSWGTIPESSILGVFDDLEKPIIPQKGTLAPYDSNEDSFFENESLVTLKSETESAQIYYTLDGTTPDSLSKRYTSPIKINQDRVLKAIAYRDGLNPSTISEKPYFESFLVNLEEGFPKITLENETTPYGLADGSMLFDQKIGTETYSDGKWTGVKDHINVLIDLGVSKNIKKVLIGALTDTGVWIFPPDKIKVFGGSNVSNLEEMGELKVEKLNDPEKSVSRYELVLNGNSCRFVKVEISNYGTAPEWHPAQPGEVMWLFVDEIIIK